LRLTKHISDKYLETLPKLCPSIKKISLYGATTSPLGRTDPEMVLNFHVCGKT